MLLLIASLKYNLCLKSNKFRNILGSREVLMCVFIIWVQQVQNLDQDIAHQCKSKNLYLESNHKSIRKLFLGWCIKKTLTAGSAETMHYKMKMDWQIYTRSSYCFIDFNLRVRYCSATKIHPFISPAFRSLE